VTILPEAPAELVAQADVMVAGPVGLAAALDGLADAITGREP
jgi:hypothetical protein